MLRKKITFVIYTYFTLWTFLKVDILSQIAKKKNKHTHTKTKTMPLLDFMTAAFLSLKFNLILALQEPILYRINTFGHLHIVCTCRLALSDEKHIYFPLLQVKVHTNKYQ